jgi:peptidoglycan-associated lipoprotein
MNYSNVRSASALVVLVTLSIAAGCSHQQSMPAPVTTTSVEVTPTAPPEVPATTRSSIYLSSQLQSECAIGTIESVNDAPKFAFDKTAILPEDQAVLAAVARCVTTGPLHGRSLQLVGRADPRGAQEYNMALGERRSNAVLKYLSALGVGSEQMNETSRGALDAKGNDETTWSQDRRVDIDIAGGAR